MSFSELMSKQRDARLAKAALVAKAAEHERLDWSESSPEEATRAFWDRVDTSGGIDACHPWTGHVNSTWAKYDVGEFKHPAFVTKLAHRVAIALTYGIEPPADTNALCGNHLCCNPNHWALWVEGRHKMATCQEFFCEAA